MIQDVIKDKKSLFDTASQTILREQENKARMVVIQQGSIVANTSQQSAGICARVYKNGVYGFSSIAEVSGEAAERVLKAATENADVLEKHAVKKKAPFSPYKNGMVLPKKCIEDLEQKKIIDFCKDVDTYIAGKYTDLVNRRVIYREDSAEKFIYTSDACDGHTIYPRCAIYISMAVAGKDGNPVELMDYFGGNGNLSDHVNNIEDVYKRADDLYNTLRLKAEGVYADAGVKTVILDPDVAGMIAHEAVGHTVEADLVLGGSVAGPNLNKQVASELISIVDFANEAFGQTTDIPVYLDDEGIEAQDAVLIENGILKSYMHNRETADHFGVKPMGNARGWGFSDEPLIRMRNTCVLPGKDKLEDMIASVDDGYYLTKTGNGQADLTGEFMFGINMGYEIKKGKLGKAILDTTVSGVAFDMLKSVDMVSDVPTWSNCGTCGKKQPMCVTMGGPSIKCKLMIGGR
ncbi:MAG: TldD/PmbA family protein [Lachnospiraceae bacterium]|nr:TldD/PmbA family protein [Lachnospiraceae bacterium]